jgi:hypothetical protein
VKKLIVLMKRKPGMSIEDFRTYYETKHAVLGGQYFDGLLIDFKRYYPREMVAFPESWVNLQFMDNADGYDAIALYTFKDDNAVARYLELMRQPEIAEALRRDELNFLDRPACRVGFCDSDEGAGIVPSR